MFDGTDWAGGVGNVGVAVFLVVAGEREIDRVTDGADLSKCDRMPALPLVVLL